MTEENIQPQDVVTQDVKPVGDIEPQPAELTDEQKLGAEKQPQVEAEKPRTYSQEEWSKREGELNKQVAERERQLAQLAMQQEIIKTQVAEREAQARDRKEVDEGSITSSEAEQRQRARVEQGQIQQQMAQQSVVLRQMMGQAEQYGRVLASQDFGKKYNLSTEQVIELLSDQSIKTPAEMDAKAANLALDKAQGELKASKEVPQVFDQGQKGGGATLTPEKALKERYPTMYKK